MTKTEAAWVAGVFEGEGCFYVNRIRKRGKTYRYPAAAINMTDRDVILKLYVTIGYGNMRERLPRQAGRKRSWYWRINGQESVSRFFREIGEHLCSRRRGRYRAIMGA